MRELKLSPLFKNIFKIYFIYIPKRAHAHVLMAVGVYIYIYILITNIL